MSVLNSIQINEMKTKLQSLGAAGIGNSSMYLSTEQQYEKYGAKGTPSIFDAAKEAIGSTTSKEEKKEPNAEQGGLMSRGFSMMKEGMSNVSEGGAKKSEVSGAASQATNNAQQAIQMKANLQQQTATSVAKMKTQADVINTTNQELQKDQSEYADLTAQVEAEQGEKQKYSALSLDIPVASPNTAANVGNAAPGASTLISPSQKNEESKDSKPQTQDDSKLTGLQSAQEEKGAKIASNQTKVNGAVTVLSTERTKINSMITNIQTFGLKSKAQAQQAAQKAAGLQKAGAITSTAGGAVGAIGATLLCFTPTAGAGAIVSAGGAVIGAGGAGMSTAASAANNDVAGASQNLSSMTSSVQTAKANVDQYNKIQAGKK